jgi:hypothetical protein
MDNEQREKVESMAACMQVAKLAGESLPEALAESRKKGTHDGHVVMPEEGMDAVEAFVRMAVEMIGSFADVAENMTKFKQ